jgi:hypothetical protein
MTLYENMDAASISVMDFMVGSALAIARSLYRIWQELGFR